MLRRTAKFKVTASENGNCYRFYCDVSGALVCTVGPFRAASPEEELQLAWETEAKKEFNFCHRCGNWVSDVMYNADVHNCVVCSPWEAPPNYCPRCGTKIRERTAFCPNCSVRLQYEGEES